MTYEQIEWAKKHDWFIEAKGDVVVVLERWTDRDGMPFSQESTFRDYESLRRWAGY